MIKKKVPAIQVHIVFEMTDDGPCLMEVFDTKVKANAYIKEKKTEYKNDSYRSHYYSPPKFSTTTRKLL